MQSTGNLIGVLVEFATCMQFRHDNLSCTAFRFMFVIELDAGRDAPPVVGDRNRIVTVQGDLDFGTVACQCLIDRVVEYFKDQMVQPGTIGGIADIHPWTFPDGFKAF